MRKLKITEMGRMNAEEFKASEKMPLIVVLDDVRSMYNVGSVFRTADAFRVEAIYLCGITAQPPHPEIHKTVAILPHRTRCCPCPQTTRLHRLFHRAMRRVHPTADPPDPPLTLPTGRGWYLCQ